MATLKVEGEELDYDVEMEFSDTLLDEIVQAYLDRRFPGCEVKFAVYNYFENRGLVAYISMLDQDADEELPFER